MFSSCVIDKVDIIIRIIYTVRNMNNLASTLEALFTLAFLRDTGQTRATSVQVRRAMRAVVKQSDRFLLVHSKR